MTPSLAAFLSGHAGKMFIDGRWTSAASGNTIDTLNPATGETLSRIAAGDSTDVAAAVAAARRALDGAWAEWKPHARAALLLKIADLVERDWDDLILLDTLDMGGPISRRDGLKAMMVGAIRFYASQAYNVMGHTLGNSIPGNFRTYTIKAPVGVVGGIIPWNGPLVSQWWLIGPVIATGCALVLKPAEDASLIVLRMTAILEEAGVPPGVVNVVTGYGAEAGHALAAHPDVDKIVFTGSTETGRRIVEASTANLKRVQLELGGKSPDIVFADADLAKAVPGAAMGVYIGSGQVCFAGTRLFVQRGIHDEFVERLAAFSATLKVGPGIDPTTQLGPLINARQLERVERYIALGPTEGAQLIHGGRRLAGDLTGGFFIEPTIFAGVRNDMRIAREEIFGPVISVIAFDDIDEAIALANDTSYGLGGAVWTQSLTIATTVSERVKSGTFWVNCYGAIDPTVGFGGYRASGYGWKGGHDALEGYLYQKLVTVNLG